MRSQRFWVLEGDEPLVERLAAGLGRSPARVLAYLLLRAEREDDPTTSVHLQVGTRLNRTTISDATTRLEETGLIGRDSLRDSEPGRPQTAWHPHADHETTIERTYDRHGVALVDRALEIHDHERTVRSADDSSLALALNWRPNALHAPFYAALASDWYETFGLDVRIEHHEGSRRALRQVGDGSADVAVAGAATVLRAREAGEPIVPVAPCYQRATTVLYTVRSVFGEPLRSVAQLEGRRIGMPPNSETKLLGRLFLSQTAFSDDVRVLDTDGEERTALVDGAADVVTGSFADPLELERRDMTVDALHVTDHFPIYGPTLVVHERTLAERAGTLERFLAATTGGWADARSDPGPAAERIAAVSDEDEARIERTFERAASAFGGSEAVRERGWGWQRREMWDRLRTALEQGRLLREPA
ncbi:myristoyl transferase [Natronococcus pandeyae]|uniref:Thiamine pyrimidine synthase n=1 Tax=Natronococcus pandeyae TaxID=2055836 RepID=A0A8J8Q448_9EURY|nr:ABC transporter substrate-binding protein [Natronococcus pandeyae]TYL40136.1 myristoyl transferase [Natronococcus pandeyae]